MIVPPDHLKTGAGKFYSVFTPYRRAWDKQVEPFAAILPVPRPARKTDIKPSKFPERIDGFDLTQLRNDLWPAGEAEAQKRLERFTERLDQYDTDRDLPSVSGTSLLSPYLAAGVISPRHCLAAARKLGDNKGAVTWVSELTWRDFYAQVLVACPRVSKHRPFKLNTDEIEWRESEEDLQAWQNGMTGFPIVDAGMRQLNRTGWMHNRLRMVTAMFLSKNLFLNWRLGERYFMRQLVDGDLAANNGGWQWSASTGTDAAPYFRIFNPFSQSKRFDPQGTFIKKMCPELESVPAAALHDPEKLTRALEQNDVDYPSFIIDYRASRERAISAFKSLA